MVVMTTIKTHFSQQKFGEIKTSLKTSLLLKSNTIVSLFAEILSLINVKNLKLQNKTNKTKITLA